MNEERLKTLRRSGAKARAALAKKRKAGIGLMSGDAAMVRRLERRARELEDQAAALRKAAKLVARGLRQ